MTEKEKELEQKKQDLDLKEYNLKMWALREKQDHEEYRVAETQSIRKIVKVMAEEHFCAKEKEIATIIANSENTLTLVKQIIEDRKEQEKLHREERATIAQNLKDFNGTMRTAIENLEKSNKETFNELFKGRNENKDEITKMKTAYKVAITIIGFLYVTALGVGGWALEHYAGLERAFHNITKTPGSTP